MLKPLNLKKNKKYTLYYIINTFVHPRNYYQLEKHFKWNIFLIFSYLWKSYMQISNFPKITDSFFKTWISLRSYRKHQWHSRDLIMTVSLFISISFFVLFIYIRKKMVFVWCLYFVKYSAFIIEIIIWLFLRRSLSLFFSILLLIIFLAELSYWFLLL